MEGRSGQPDWPAVVRHELVEGWPRWLSFACIWLWTCIVGASPACIELAVQMGSFMAVPTVFVLFAAVGTLVVVICLSDVLSTIAGSRGAMGLSGFLLVSGSLLVGCSMAFGGVVPFVAGSCMGGAAIGFLKIAWGEMFSRMSLRAGLACMGTALVASTAAALCLLCLPVCCQALALVACSLPCSALARRGTGLLACDAPPPPPPGAAKTVAFSWTLLILPALVGLSAGLVGGVLAARPAQSGGLQSIGFLVAEMMAGVALLCSSKFLSARFGAPQIYAAGLLFTVAGIAFTATGAIPPWLAASVHRLGFSLFYFFMVVYWGDLARRMGRPVVRTYALGYTVLQAAQIPGLMAGYGLSGSAQSSAMALLFTSVVLAFFVIVLLVYTDTRSSLRRWLTAGEPTEATDEIPEACAALSARFSLSPREREVLSLLARGRTASYVGKSLGIAPDTAKTHIRSIYRKLGVHTQQELIDLVLARADE